MSIKQETYLYEILVRGTPDGAIAGAHQVRAERIVDGDVVLLERTLDPTPLDPADVHAVLGASFASLASELDATRARLASAIQERDAALGALAAATGTPAAADGEASV